MKWSREFSIIKQVMDVNGIINKSIILHIPFHSLKVSDYNLVSFHVRKDCNMMYVELDKKPEVVDLEKMSERFHHLS